jgi:hypothetical protein
MTLFEIEEQTRRLVVSQAKINMERQNLQLAFKTPSKVKFEHAINVEALIKCLEIVPIIGVVKNVE